MVKILIVTVGGSHQPIVTAIRTLVPDRVVFICSEGSRGSQSQVIGKDKPCEVRQGNQVIERLPNIPTQVELGDRFQEERDLILLQAPDDLSECYSKVVSGIQKLQQELPDAQIMADYTGGTKTMSVGLAMAAIDYGVTLYLTTGNRTDIIRVNRGEMTGQAFVAPVIVQRTIEQLLPILLQQYNYPAAIVELRRILSSIALTPETKLKVQDLLTFCAGLDAWDRFNHQEALELLEPYMKYSEIRDLILFLKRAINSRSKIDENFESNKGTNGHGYEIVQDLLLNAQRRALQERYDDAVGRLYRALELLEQIRLLEAYQIETGDVDLEKIPESLRESYECKRSPIDNKVQLALRDSYELLSRWGDDPVGQIYQSQASKILNALKIRNNSLFAHGFQPISLSDYQEFGEVVIDFIKSSIAAVTSSRQSPSQFPVSLEFLG